MTDRNCSPTPTTPQTNELIAQTKKIAALKNMLYDDGMQKSYTDARGRLLRSMGHSIADAKEEKELLFQTQTS